MNLLDPILTDTGKAPGLSWGDPMTPVYPHRGVVDKATALKVKAHRPGVYGRDQRQAPHLSADR
jgi:hypothetical protein